MVVPGQRRHLLQERDAAVVAQLLGDLQGLVEACWQRAARQQTSAREVHCLLRVCSSSCLPQADYPYRTCTD